MQTSRTLKGSPRGRRCGCSRRYRDDHDKEQGGRSTPVRVCSGCASRSANGPSSDCQLGKRSPRMCLRGQKGTPDQMRPNPVHLPCEEDRSETPASMRDVQ
uniref:Uncharacterized protein n=1 Tax=viral metagenome TaxID=1070528 RepID=A0A6C0KSM7_9ZZZZ